MSTPEGRRVRIGVDERTGWSSDRPRRDGQPEKERGPNIAVRCRTLSPTDRQRYSPGSVVVVVGGTTEQREQFADKRVEEKSAVLSATRVRKLIEGRVDADQLDAAVDKVLDATVAKRLGSDGSIVVLVDDLTPESRARFVLPAAKLRRPRHLVFLDAPGEAEDKETLNALRRAVQDGGMGEEGFMTALRLSGKAIEELKRVVFRPPPADD